MRFCVDDLTAAAFTDERLVPASGKMARCGAGADSDAIRGEPLCHVAHCTWPGTEFGVRGSYPCKESLRMERGEWGREFKAFGDFNTTALSSRNPNETTLANNSIGNNLDSLGFFRNAIQCNLRGKKEFSGRFPSSSATKREFIFKFCSDNKTRTGDQLTWGRSGRVVCMSPSVPFVGWTISGG